MQRKGGKSITRKIEKEKQFQHPKRKGEGYHLHGGNECAVEFASTKRKEYPGLIVLPTKGRGR